MDKNAIKKYAVWARNELIARVTQKAGQYEITEKKTTPKDADSIGGRLLTEAEKNQRKALIEKIEADGFEQVMEEVAYTWFNRFTALRFMEVNNYLPSHTRVFTNESGEFKPQILADAIQLDLEGLNMDKVFELKEANKTEELYKYLLITQCNALSAILPRMFQKIEHYTELLLPDYLLREGSVIEQMIALIPEEDWTDQVQIIGWLYQFYMAEPKDRLINARKQYADKDIATVEWGFSMLSAIHEEDDTDRDDAFYIRRIIDNYAVIFLQDAWEPENSKHNKFSFGFADETYFNMFIEALQVAKFNNRMSAILININTRKVVKEYNFPCKNFSETESLFDMPVHQEEEHGKGDFRQMTFFDGFNGEDTE